MNSLRTWFAPCSTGPFDLARLGISIRGLRPKAILASFAALLLLLTLAALAATVVGALAPLEPPPPPEDAIAGSGASLPAHNPFPSASLPPDQRFTFEGTIEERIDTGDYRYMRVGETWVVSLAFASPSEGRVRVTALGRATDFESRRLGRRFDVLVFGMVRAAQAAESEVP
jgi:hypothetical protein